MARTRKTDQSPLRKQGTNQNRDRKGAAEAPSAMKNTSVTIITPDVAPSSLPDPKSMEQTFRERQAATSAISKLIMEEMQKTDRRALRRRSCWLVINELYNRMCCPNKENSLADIQKINRILMEQGKLEVLKRKSKSRTRQKATSRSGPIPDSLSDAIRDLYGGSITTADSIAPQNSPPTDNRISPPRNGLTIDNTPDNS